MNETERALLVDTFATIRADLTRLVSSRLDKRLAGRVDSSDIVQNTYLAAFQRYPEYLSKPEVPLDDWIRYLAIQSVTEAHRFHLSRQKRAVGREVTPDSESVSIAKILELLSGSLTSPHSAAMKAELQQAVRELIGTMSETDREIILLRHEQMLSNEQCAQHVGISQKAASKRYIRAITRLRSIAKDYLA